MTEAKDTTTSFSSLVLLPVSEHHSCLQFRLVQSAIGSMFVVVSQQVLRAAPDHWVGSSFH